MGTQAVSTAAKFSDEGVLFDEIYAQIKAALAPIGAHDAIEQISRGGADYALRQYMAEVQNGVPAGRARQNAVSTGKVWAESEAKKHGVTPAGAPVGPADTSVVNVADIQQAADAYRTGISSGQQQRQQIINHVPNPTAAGTQTPVQSQSVQLDTAQADQTRALQQGAVGYLDASAQGKGVAGQLASARLAQALRAGAAQASGIAQGATGAARKGAARSGALAANQAALAGGAKVAEVEAATALAAQGQLASALQGVRAGDITQSGQGADVAAGNANRDLTAQTTRNDQGLRAQGQDEDQRVANERLKLDAQAAIEGSAKGLLDEAQREATLSMARRQLDLAERRFQLEVDQAKKEDARKDREFWAGVIAQVAGALVPGPPKAAHGGLVTESTMVEVGEAGPELIIPVNVDVAAKLAKALTIASKPFDRKDAPSLSALLKLLKSGGSEEERPKVPAKMAAILASGNSKARKAGY
jgi:hypothetical protein